MPSLSTPVKTELATRPPLDLEQPLSLVETCLSDLGEALQRRDSEAIELQAASLQQALRQAIATFKQAAQAGGVPPLLRRRLMAASGQVAAQREALARATAALDRALDVLMPAEPNGLYEINGKAGRKIYGGYYQA